MKSSYVASLQNGERVDDIYLVADKKVGKTRDGSTYIRLQLCDRTGTIDGIKWDASESLCANIAIDDFVLVRGTVGTYREKPQINLESFQRFDDPVDLAEFLLHSERDPQEMYGVLCSIIGSIKEPSLAKILDFFFSDKAFVERFITAPAAKSIHHAYIAGLLEHTLSVAQNCDMIAARYPQLNRDLLVTGAILHDIGKIGELSWGRSIHYSDVGHLIGHIVQGCSMVEKAADTVPDMPQLLKLELMHMMISHHGEKEWGSPKRPKSLEAIVLHFMDDIDAKVDMVIKATTADTSDPKSLWTEFHSVLGRPLLRRQKSAGQKENTNNKAESEPETDEDPFI